MTTLSDYGINLNIAPPADPKPRYEYLLQDADWHEAINIAIKHREHHPRQAVEIWPRDGSHRVDVVREVPGVTG